MQDFGSVCSNVQNYNARVLFYHMFYNWIIFRILNICIFAVTNNMLRRYWRICIYDVASCSFFNYSKYGRTAGTQLKYLAELPPRYGSRYGENKQGILPNAAYLLLFTDSRENIRDLMLNICPTCIAAAPRGRHYRVSIWVLPFLADSLSFLYQIFNWVFLLFYFISICVQELFLRKAERQNFGKK